MDENTSNNNNGKKLLYGLIALLLLINGIAFYLLFKENKEKTVKTEQLAKKETEFNELNTQFDAQKQELEAMKGKNAELDAIITQKQEEIVQLQARMATAQRNGATDLSKYKKMLADLQAETATLQAKVKELESKNEELTAENLKVSKDLEAEKVTTTKLAEEKTVLTEEKNNLKTLGSLLSPKNLKVEGIDKRKSGKEVVKNRTKRVDFLKISFETGDNKVLEQGPLTIYTRIINPKGETISLADQGSGKMKLNNGEEVLYTRKIETSWDKMNKALSLEWGHNISDKGTYKVELYQNGYLIGTGSTELK